MLYASQFKKEGYETLWRQFYTFINMNSDKYENVHDHKK